MPIVPTYQEKQKNLPTPTNSLRIDESAQPTTQRPNQEVSDRMKLADAVRSEVANKGYVSDSFLDHFAFTHLNTEQDNPAVWDYAALRRVALQEETHQRQQAQTQALQREATWMMQVGQLATDAASLQAYLKLQIPAYQTRMQEMGIPAKQAQITAENLQAKMVEKNILCSISNGDWVTAQEVFNQQKDIFSESVRQNYSEKIRSVFARFEAQNLWKQAQNKSVSKGTDAQTVALSLITEPDEELRQAIKREIILLADMQKKHQMARKAEVFTQLSQADGASVQQLLDRQTALESDDMPLVRQAASHIQTPPTERQKEWFVQHYFQADSAKPEQAFVQGLCSARDYFRLQASSQRRKSGEDLSDEQWLYRGLKSWMEQQGFSAKDINRAAYDVLSGAADHEGRVKIWKKIKTLLTC